MDRAVNLAKLTNLFDDIVITTDKLDIEDYLSAKSVTIHFRSEKLSADQAKTIDVIKEVIKSQNISQEAKICCLYPTSLLLSTSRLFEGRALLELNDKTFVFAAQILPSSPLRSFQIDLEEKRLIFVSKESLSKNTQDIPNFYSDAGQFYWGTASSWLSNESLINSLSVPVVLRRWETIDIDYPEDLEIATNILNIREMSERV